MMTYNYFMLLSPHIKIKQTLNNTIKMRLINEILQIPKRKERGEVVDYGYWPYLCAFLASIVYPTSWLYANEHGVAMGHTTLLRGFMGVTVNYLICRATNSDTAILLYSKTFKQLLFRAVIYAITSLFVGAAQFILPLSAIYTVVGTSTLFIFLLDYLLNGVKFNLKQGVGIFIGLLGALLASNCKIIQYWINGATSQPSAHHRARLFLTTDIYIIAAFTVAYLLLMVVWSYATLLTKKIGHNTFQINFFTGFIYAVIGALALLASADLTQGQGSLFKTEPKDFYMSVIFTGVPLMVQQWLIICAYSMTKSSGIISMICFSNIVVGYLIGLLRYGEKPNMVMNVGIVLLAVGLYQALFNSEAKPSQQPQQIRQSDVRTDQS